MLLVFSILKQIYLFFHGTDFNGLMSFIDLTLLQIIYFYYVLSNLIKPWSKQTKNFCLIQTAQMIILTLCYVNTSLILAPLRSLQRLLYLKLIPLRD